MAKKHKHEEHENLERWLVSYGDFITLLFATFVVLYALAQTDVSKFVEFNKTMKGSFTNSILQGQGGILDNGEKPLSSDVYSILDSLILEYMNPQYEKESFDEIKDEIDKLKSEKQIDGVDVEVTDRGLVIMFSGSDMLFAPASAELTSMAKRKLDKIGAIIGKRFLLHLMRVEGHTDNIPFSSKMYPSNWELSSARACSVVRHLIFKFKFEDELFTPIGYADTRPLVPNNSEKNRAKNRRVDIVVLRNKYKMVEDARDSFVKMDKKQQEELRNKHIETINTVLNLSDAASQLQDDNEDKKVILLKDR